MRHPRLSKGGQLPRLRKLLKVTRFTRPPLSMLGYVIRNSCWSEETLQQAEVPSSWPQDFRNEDFDGFFSDTAVFESPMLL